MKSFLRPRVICAVGVLALLACTQPSPPAGPQLTLRRGLNGEPSTLDPAIAGDTFSTDLIQDLYEGLTVGSADGQVIPGVAESWTADSTGTEYTFKLRSDARWSNGAPVTAQQFVTAWRRVVDPKSGSPEADNLRLIAGASAILAGNAPPESLAVTATSPNVLLVKLQAPAPYLPQLLSYSVAFPTYSPASAKSHDPATWVSNGAYVLRKWNPGSSIDLARNESYWDKEHVQIPNVQYQFATDEAAQFARFRAGEIDLTDVVPANALPALRAAHSTELVLTPFLATAYYGLNLEQGPVAKNVRLRQALAMAIDRHRLVDALGFGQAPAYGFVPAGIWNYSPQTFPWANLSDEARVAEAQRLFKSSGFQPGTAVTLRVLHNSNPVIRQTAILIAAMWKEVLGVNTELNDEEYKVFLQSRHDRARWDAARFSWNADFNDASNFLDIFRKASANNDEAYANPAVDSLLEEAEKTADPAMRRAQLEKVEWAVLNDYPVIPLYFLVSRRLVKPYVLGLHPTPLNIVPSKTLRMLPGVRPGGN
jgi:oligopeptide transport system substrate-binding protein